MNDETAGGIPWSFWAISAIALVWNVLGGLNFVIQMDAEVVAAMPETHRAIIDTRPAWATGGFAIGVFVGALGCLLLLFKKSAAYYLFMVSLVGMIVTMVHTVRVATSVITFSPFEIVMMILMPLVVAVFLIWFSKQAESKGWIS